MARSSVQLELFDVALRGRVAEPRRYLFQLAQHGSLGFEVVLRSADFVDVYAGQVSAK